MPNNFIQKLRKSLKKRKTRNIRSKTYKKQNKKKTRKTPPSKTPKQRKLKGGSACDEYAYVNEPGLTIPGDTGDTSVPGLNIVSSRASIGKVKTCNPINHPPKL